MLEVTNTLQTIPWKVCIYNSVERQEDSEDIIVAYGVACAYAASNGSMVEMYAC